MFYKKLLILVLFFIPLCVSAKTVHSTIQLSVVGISDMSRTVFMFSEEPMENSPCGGKKLLRYDIDKENSLWKEVYSTALTAWVSKSKVMVGYDDDVNNCYGGAEGDSPRIVNIRLVR